MEEKLEAYRRRKRREETVKGFKEKFVKMVSFQQVRVDSLRTDSAEKAVDQISVDTVRDLSREILIFCFISILFIFFIFYKATKYERQ